MISKLKLILSSFSKAKQKSGALTDAEYQKLLAYFEKVTRA